MPIVTDPADYARFREVFDAAGYSEEALAKKFGPVRLPGPGGAELPFFLHRTRELTPLDAIVRLFLLAAPVETEAASAALAPVPLETWLGAGLLRRTEEAVVGAVCVQSFRGLLLACDHPVCADAGPRFEQVMGITTSTRLLADFAVRRPGGETLDLGTGNGVQAFLAAPHSARVRATDRGARCLEFARFNAGLNGISNVEFLEGDAFEPVAGRRFSLVLMNPPFAITPSQRYLYRDSGLELDQFARRIVRRAPDFLEEGGFCQLLCDWVQLAGQDWKDRLASWFEGCGCDVWVLCVEEHGADEYARMWVRDTEHVSPGEAARLFCDSVEYYERHQVESIGSGLVAMRRNSGAPNWLRIEEAPDSHTAFFGDCVLRGFALRDYLERTSDEALLEECLRVSPEARISEQHQPAAQGWRLASAQIRLARGLEYAGNLDLRLLELVMGCDGRQPLRELLRRLADRVGASVDKIAPPCLALLRQLIERGFLLP